MKKTIRTQSPRDQRRESELKFVEGLLLKGNLTTVAVACRETGQVWHYKNVDPDAGLLAEELQDSVRHLSEQLDIARQDHAALKRKNKRLADDRDQIRVERDQALDALHIMGGKLQDSERLREELQQRNNRQSKTIAELQGSPDTRGVFIGQLAGPLSCPISSELHTAPPEPPAIPREQVLEEALSMLAEYDIIGQDMVDAAITFARHRLDKLNRGH